VKRIAVTILFMLAALVCGYMFLAGFEYPGITRWKIVTGVLGVLFLALAIRAARKDRPT